MKQMSASPIIVSALMSQCNVEGSSSLKSLVESALPTLKGTTANSNANDEDALSESSDDEEEEEEEDEMYRGMTDEEKIEAMRLNKNKVDTEIYSVLNAFESIIEKIKNEVSPGILISSKVKLNKSVSVWVKPKRKKQQKQVIDLIDTEKVDTDRAVEEKKEEQIEEEDDEWVPSEFLPFPISDGSVGVDDESRVQKFETFAQCVDEFYTTTEKVWCECYGIVVVEVME